MTCDQFTEELDLYLGQTEFPEALTAHMATCASCRAYAEQMQSLAASLGDDRLFEPNLFETKRIVSQIEDAIAEKDQPSSWLWRFRFVAAAAVIVLAVAVGVDQYRNGKLGDVLPSDTAGFALNDTNPLAVDSLQVTDTELEDMLLEYSAQDDEAAGQVLENLTEEELQYLEKNFDVGELL